MPKAKDELMNKDFFKRVLKFNQDAGNINSQFDLTDEGWMLEGRMLTEEFEEFCNAVDGLKKVKVNGLVEWQPVETPGHRRQEIADALLDIIYVAMGTLGKLGIDYNKGMDEVCTSNETKYVKGILQRDEKGKVTKGANFVPPNLSFAREPEIFNLEETNNDSLPRESTEGSPS